MSDQAETEGAGGHTSHPVQEPSNGNPVSAGGPGRGRRFLLRAAAQVLDLLFLLLLAYSFARARLGLLSPVLALVILIEVGYQLRGSLGKSIFGLSIRLRNRWQLYFRETVGKVLSSVTFGIGFLLALGRDESTFHDLLAKTSVVLALSKTPSQRRIQVGGWLTMAALAGFYLANVNTSPNAENKLQVVSDRTLNAVTRQIPAVLTIRCYNSKNQPDKQGSGFLITSDGVAITNFHVIRGAHRADVELGNGRLYEIAAVRNFDPDLDVAVLQLGRRVGGEASEVNDLPFVQLGDSRSVKVGDRVATIGSPEGLSNTVSDGLVSAIRTLDSRTLFQITAPISHGSSGGPVFTLDGKVVGVSVGQFGEGQNLNFAIPVSDLQEIRQQDYHLDLDAVRILAPSLSSTQHENQSSGHVAIDNQPPAKLTTLSGFYIGTVHNLTADKSASFGIISEEHSGTLAGCMMVTAPLFGSGPFDGVHRGSHVQFTVVHSETVLTFDGMMQNHEVAGSYTVSTPGMNVQYGKFSLKRRSGTVSFDLSGGCPTDEEMNR